MKQKIIVTISFAFIFLFSAKAQYVNLYEFTDSPDGSYPWGSLFSDSTYLYGTTGNGGIYSSGTVFRIKTDGTGYSKLFDFGTLNGMTPVGSLISDGTFLYGTTEDGGTDSLGTLFKIKPDGTGFTKLLDFAGLLNGREPSGSLLFDGTFLYGTTVRGGTSNSGVIFKIKPDGSAFTKLIDFNGANGRSPFGTLIYDGIYMYGMTLSGGPSDDGVIFRIMPDGSNYSLLHTFLMSVDGRKPYGSLVSDGTFLYGMTTLGNAGDSGSVFKIKPDGTLFSTMLNFASTDAYWPYGSLIFHGAKLYGMTQRGGVSDAGTAFRINTDGTGYTKIFDFNYTNGRHPFGDLLSDGIYLYGMAWAGGSGANDFGTIFKLGPTTEIPELDQNVTLSTFPNPTTGNIYINGNSYQTIKLYNGIGECLYSTSESITQIDLSSFTQGIYFLEARSTTACKRSKIILIK